ncbi:MAG: hypothetical protein M5U26_13315 [Planctomycetota bacterium]|nr:hypothetical protein [Planctomycetota bacterium]
MQPAAHQQWTEAELKARIPPDYLQKLHDLRPILEKQGTVLIRHGQDRRQAFYLRYREKVPDGRWVHRAIAMGGWDSGPYARLIIKKWRAERREARAAELASQAEAARIARLEDRARRVERRLLRKILPGGRLFRRNAMKAFDEAVGKSPLQALGFLHGIDSMQPARPGRPRRGRLW